MTTLSNKLSAAFLLATAGTVANAADEQLNFQPGLRPTLPVASRQQQANVSDATLQLTPFVFMFGADASKVLFNAKGSPALDLIITANPSYRESKVTQNSLTEFLYGYKQWNDPQSGRNSSKAPVYLQRSIDDGASKQVITAFNHRWKI